MLALSILKFMFLMTNINVIQVKIKTASPDLHVYTNDPYMYSLASQSMHVFLFSMTQSENNTLIKAHKTCLHAHPVSDSGRVIYLTMYHII